MKIRSIMGIVAVLLLLGYVAPLVYKLKDLALGVVVAVGVVMMLADLWHSLQDSED